MVSDADGRWTTTAYADSPTGGQAIVAELLRIGHAVMVRKQQFY